MTVLTLKNKYQADISTATSGTELIAVPCTVYDITVVSDAAGDASVSFSNTTSSYSNTYRLAKTKTTDERQTVQLIFPKGKKFSNGLCAVANKASVDVFVTYE